VRDACILACASHREQWELLNAALMRLHAFAPSGVDRLDLAHARKLLQAHEQWLRRSCEPWRNVVAMRTAAAKVVPPDLADNMRASGRSEEEITAEINRINGERDAAAAQLPGQCVSALCPETSSHHICL
jgi:hypothetical protein